MRFCQTVTLLFSVMLTVGCRKETPKPVSEIQWTVIADGSNVWVSTDGNAAWKCRPQAKLFRCIWVSKTNVDLTKNYYDIFGASLDHLPKDWSPDQGAKSQYFCHYAKDDDSTLDIYQAISVDGETVVSKRSSSRYFEDAAADKADTPWDKDYVDSFASRNRLALVPLYFDCLSIGSALSAGSLTTLKTDLIKLQ